MKRGLNMDNRTWRAKEEVKQARGPKRPQAKFYWTARTAAPKATAFIESMMMMTLMREGCRIGCSANPPRIVLRLSRSHKHCRSINLCKSKNAITVCDTELNTFVRYRTRGMATEKDKWAIISKNVRNWRPQMAKRNFSKVSTLWTCQRYMENMSAVLKPEEILFWGLFFRQKLRKLRTFLKLLPL